MVNLILVAFREFLHAVSTEKHKSAVLFLLSAASSQIPAHVSVPIR